MAGSWSDYLENEMLDHVFGGGDYSRPATVYVALFTADPSDAGGGTEVVAVGTGYARVAVTNNSTNFPAASGGSKANGTAIEFPEAADDWGTCTAFGIFDEDEEGNLLCWGELTVDKAASAGDTLKFAIGDLVITQD